MTTYHKQCLGVSKGVVCQRQFPQQIFSYGGKVLLWCGCVLDVALWCGCAFDSAVFCATVCECRKQEWLEIGDGDAIGLLFQQLAYDIGYCQNLCKPPSLSPALHGAVFHCGRLSNGV